MKKSIFIVLGILASLILLPIVLWLIYHLIIFLNYLFLQYIDVIDLFFNDIPISQGVAFISLFLSIGGLYLFISEVFFSD